MQESFRAAKMAFWKVKLTVKETLALDHVGPEPLDVAALEYIACHKDLYDVCCSVQVSQGQWGSDVAISFGSW